VEGFEQTKAKKVPDTDSRILQGLEFDFDEDALSEENDGSENRQKEAKSVNGDQDEQRMSDD
jgi:hypothetical protein